MNEKKTINQTRHNKFHLIQKFLDEIKKNKFGNKFIIWKNYQISNLFKLPCQVTIRTNFLCQFSSNSVYRLLINHRNKQTETFSKCSKIFWVAIFICKTIIKYWIKNAKLPLISGDPTICYLLSAICVTSTADAVPDHIADFLPPNLYTCHK